MTRRNEYRNSLLMACYYLDLSSNCDWMKQILLAVQQIKAGDQKCYPDLGSPTSSIRNFCVRSSDVISWENHVEAWRRGGDFAWTNEKHYPGQGNDTSSVWNFCSRFSGVISWETSGGVEKCRLFSQACHYLDLDSASDWLKLCLNQWEALPRSG